MKVLSLKGLVWGIRWTTKQIEKYTDIISEYDVISWDGDLYKHDSFTYLLMRVMKKHPEKTYIAHKKFKSIYKLEGTYVEDDNGVEATGYKNIDNILIHGMTNDIKHSLLGNLALKWLIDRYDDVVIDVLILGQGPKGKAEFEIMKTYPRVNIMLEYVVRGEN